MGIYTNATKTLFGAYITLKYDSSGTLLWTRTYDAGWEDYAQDVAVDDSDNIIITGYSDSNINWDWCTIKYNPDGDTIWARRYDIAKTDWAFGVTTDIQENVIVVGKTHQLLPGTGGSSGMMIKYSAEGNVLWTKIFTDTLQYAEVGSLVDVVTDDSGNIYATGEYCWWEFDGRIWYDYYVVKCNSQGDIIWTTRCDNNIWDEPNAIALDKEGNIIVIGTTSENPNMYKFDYLTVKLQNVTNEVSVENVATRGFLLHPNCPNPFNQSTVISYQLPARGFVSLKVFDLLGREVETLVSKEQLAGTYTAAWNAARLTSGIYIARLTAGNLVASIKLLFIR